MLIYDAKVSDNAIQKLLQERAKAGVEIRILGKLEKSIEGIDARKLSSLRLHVRAIIRDGKAAFIGSQSLRKLELDKRREVGVLVANTTIAKKMQSAFEVDWKASAPAKASATSAA